MGTAKLVSLLLCLVTSWSVQAQDSAVIYVYEGHRWINSKSYWSALKLYQEQGTPLPALDESQAGRAVWDFYYAFARGVDPLNTQSCYLGSLEEAFEIVKFVTGADLEDNQDHYVRNLSIQDETITFNRLDRDIGDWVRVRIQACDKNMLM